MSQSFSVRRAEERIAKAKRDARPELIFGGSINEWNQLNLAQRLDTRIEPIAKRDELERIDVTKVSRQEFIDQYERPLRPTVLTHVIDNWPAKEKWTIPNLQKRFQDERFKCGEDDYGYNVKLKMKYFVYYMTTNCDDSPLYIFDGNFGEHRTKKKLLSDYHPPEYFKEDLFELAGHSRRPPYRWIVIGSARSGTGVHIDPLGTSAWNALLVGYKRWCLFPTTTPRSLLKLNQQTGGKQFSEAAQWFNLVYPRTQEPTWPCQYKPIEILQRPGETVFVPSGWWHVVMNLTDTIAITHNFVSTTNFPVVWHKVVRSRPKLSKKWLAQLKHHRPDLAELTKRIDLNQPTGITSDSSSGSSSSSSSSTSSSSPSSASVRSSCSCSSCNRQAESDDSGQKSLSNRPKRKRYDSWNSRGDGQIAVSDWED